MEGRAEVSPMESARAAEELHRARREAAMLVVCRWCVSRMSDGGDPKEVLKRFRDVHTLGYEHVLVGRGFEGSVVESVDMPRPAFEVGDIGLVDRPDSGREMGGVSYVPPGANPSCTELLQPEILSVSSRPVGSVMYDRWVLSDFGVRAYSFFRPFNGYYEDTTVTNGSSKGATGVRDSLRGNPKVLGVAKRFATFVKESARFRVAGSMHRLYASKRPEDVPVDGRDPGIDIVYHPTASSSRGTTLPQVVSVLDSWSGHPDMPEHPISTCVRTFAAVGVCSSVILGKMSDGSTRTAVGGLSVADRSMRSVLGGMSVAAAMGSVADGSGTRSVLGAVLASASHAGAIPTDTAEIHVSPCKRMRAYLSNPKRSVQLQAPVTKKLLEMHPELLNMFVMSATLIMPGGSYNIDCYGSLTYSAHVLRTAKTTSPRPPGFAQQASCSSETSLYEDKDVVSALAPACEAIARHAMWRANTVHDSVMGCSTVEELSSLELF